MLVKFRRKGLKIVLSHAFICVLKVNDTLLPAHEEGDNDDDTEDNDDDVDDDDEHTCT